MKIAILSLQSRFGDVTGDCVQAEKTAAALRALGEDAARYFLDVISGAVYNESNELLGNWADVFGDMDIIHTIPPIPFGNIKRLPKVKAKLVASTVFWCSPTYWKVLLRTKPNFDKEFAKLIVRELLGRVGVRLLTKFDGYDLLLPNSEAEAENVRKYCRVKTGVRIVPVPNGIDPIPDDSERLSRPEGVPDTDYMLVPGCFHPRKNQETLIRALSDFPHPIVFMGSGVLLEKCKRLASSRMIFLGHIPHGTSEFYAIFKFARLVCLSSNCETPSIAALEGAAMGARPVVPLEGGTREYYGDDAQYLDPLSQNSIATAVNRAWVRGRLSEKQRMRYRALTWQTVAEKTLEAYGE